jgi:uncharacterized protein
MFHGDSRALQDQFDTRRIADRIEGLLVHETFDENDAAFIESRDMFFLATVDAEGRPNCSYKGGDPGFVRVVDERTLAFPCYNGNGMFVSMGNVQATKHVGMLFIDFEDPSRIRVNGDASIHHEDPLLAEFPEALFMVRVTAREIFPNCPRYIHRYQKAEASAFVPREGCKTPVPGWKRSGWARNALPKDDPANDPTAEVV